MATIFWIAKNKTNFPTDNFKKVITMTTFILNTCCVLTDPMSTIKMFLALQFNRFHGVFIAAVLLHFYTFALKKW